MANSLVLHCLLTDETKWSVVQDPVKGMKWWFSYFFLTERRTNGIDILIFQSFSFFLLSVITLKAKYAIAIYCAHEGVDKVNERTYE